MVVRCQRVLPAEVVHAIVLGAEAPQQAVRRGVADTAAAGFGAGPVQADAPGHAPVGLQGMAIGRSGLAVLALAGAGRTQPRQDGGTLVAGLLARTLPDRSLRHHVEPQLVPQCRRPARRFGWPDQRRERPAPTHRHAVAHAAGGCIALQGEQCCGCAGWAEAGLAGCRPEIQVDVRALVDQQFTDVTQPEFRRRLQVLHEGGAVCVEDEGIGPRGESGLQLLGGGRRPPALQPFILVRWRISGLQQADQELVLRALEVGARRIEIRQIQVRNAARMYRKGDSFHVHCLQPVVVYQIHRAPGQTITKLRNCV